MARYHINPKTGNPGVCRAVKSCPFGDLEADHYESKAAARSSYEEAQVSAVPGPQKTYEWPERSEVRKFKTKRGEVMFQIGRKLRIGGTEQKVQAWLTTPEDGTVAFVELMVHGEDYYESLGSHFSMCDVETRVDARKKGFARELRESIEKETGMLIYSSGNMTPEGWAAFGEHVRVRPNPYASSWDKPGVKFNSMGFVASWKHKLPRFNENSIDYTDEQRDAMYDNREIYDAFDNKEILWAEE